jgi:hypothetical protein
MPFGNDGDEMQALISTLVETFVVELLTKFIILKRNETRNYKDKEGRGGVLTKLVFVVKR